VDKFSEQSLISLNNERKNSDMMKTLYYYICCELFTEIIECVNYLHGRNVIYRDLKPANISITDGINGRLKYDIKADIYSLGKIVENLFFFIDNF
jgi:serine/threonine protein kinase